MRAVLRYQRSATNRQIVKVSVFKCTKHPAELYVPAGVTNAQDTSTSSPVESKGTQNSTNSPVPAKSMGISLLPSAKVKFENVNAFSGEN